MMGQHCCFYVERWTGAAWEHVGDRIDGEFAFVGRCAKNFQALGGYDTSVLAVDGPPKGLPADVSQHVREAAVASLAGQSFYDASWHTLGTLQRYDWTEVCQDMPDILRRMSNIGSPADVRAVFWFGS